MTDDTRKLLLSHLSSWKARPLIVEFKGAFSVISGLFNISDLSESKLRLLLSGSTCAICEMDVCLSSVRGFTVKTFQDAKNSVFKPAVEALVVEAGHSFESDVVEEVAVLDLWDGGTLLLGP